MGEVISQPNYCTSSTGFPFIIKYLDKMNHSDTIITITLPIQFKFIGQKIEFEMRELTLQDERIACTNLFDIPKQTIYLMFHHNKLNFYEKKYKALFDSPIDFYVNKFLCTNFLLFRR
ncbi:MAG: hypothetical protein ABIO55_15115 [Ginsengibacter sp.]